MGKTLASRCEDVNLDPQNPCKARGGGMHLLLQQAETGEFPRLVQACTAVNKESDTNKAEGEVVT